MNVFTAETHPLAQKVEFTADDLVVSLVDGRKVVVPSCGFLVWQMP